MTFKQYVDKLSKFLAEHPEYAGCIAICAKDDEGNGYTKVYYDPSPGHVEDPDDYNFESCYGPDACEEEDLPINAIVIN